MANKGSQNDIGGTLTSLNSVTISDSGYIVSSTAGTTLSIVNGFTSSYSSGQSTWAINLQLTQDQTFNTTAAGIIAIFSGTLDLASYTLTVDGPGETDQTHLISGTGGITKNGTGRLSLANLLDNTYTGKTTVNSGTLFIISEGDLGANPSSFAADQLTIDGGTVEAGLDININDVNRGITVGSSGGTIVVDATKTMAVAINVVLSGDLVANCLGNLTFDSTATAVSGAGGITKTGSGTLKLISGANTYTGKTIANAGVLVIDRETSLGGNPDSWVPDQLTIDGATLEINNNAEIGYANQNCGVTLGAGGGIVLTDLGVAAQIDNEITGAGSLTKNGTGQLTLKATVATGGGKPYNTYEGATIINVGNLVVDTQTELGNDPGSFTPGQLTINGGIFYASDNFSIDSNRGTTVGTSGGTIYVYGGKTLTMAKAITGSGSGVLTKTGGGTLTLSVANDYTGGTTLSTGFLNINNANALGTGTFTISAGTIDNTSSSFTLAGVTSHAWNGNFTFTGTQDLNLGTGSVTINANRTVTTTTAGKTLTVGGAISESGGSRTLTKAGNGTLKLTAANSYTGNTTVSAGVLSIDGEDRLGSNPGTFTAARLTLSGTLNAFGSFTINNNRGITLSGTAATISVDSGVTLEVDKAIAGGSSGNTIPLTKAGSGILKLAAANSYWGKTLVTAGTLSINDETCLGSAGTSATADQLTISGNATLNAYGDVTINDANRGVTLGSSGGTLSADSGVTMTVAKVIAGSSNPLTKAGLGTVNLTQPNTYSGTTTVSAGKLLVNGSTASGSAVTVASTATLGGVGTVGGTVVANGTLAPGNSPGTLTTSSETWNGGGIYEFQITNATSSAGLGWDLLNNTGSLTVGATSGNQFTIKVVSLDASSAANPAANFDNTANYTWLIATNDGGVTGFAASSFLIDTNGFKNDQGPGRFLISQSGKNVYLQFGHVTANAATASRAWGTYVRISKSDFLNNNTSGGTGNHTLLSVTSPVTGDFVDYSGTEIMYAPIGHTNTVLSYMVSDSSTPTAFTATNTLTVLVTNAISITSITNSITTNSLTVTLTGIPGFSYAVERSTNLVNWDTVQTTNLPTSPTAIGVWSYTDSPPPNPAFYRTRQNNTLE